MPRLRLFKALGFFCSLFSSCQTTSEENQEIKSMTAQMNHLLYLPQRYQTGSTEKYPLIVFLHGSGERGNDIELVRKYGLPQVVEGQPDFPFIVVAPQCPAGIFWSVKALNDLLDKIIAEDRVDADRVYLTGLSMGGYGTWDWAIQSPDRFAAIAPICGGGNPDKVRAIRSMPVWVFHGAKDPTVPIAESEKMVKALKKAGSNVKFTVYPEAGHDSWTETYNNPELYKWFLSHKR